MEEQKEKIELTKEEIRELINNLEPGTMLTLEMPGPEKTDQQRMEKDQKM